MNSRESFDEALRKIGVDPALSVSLTAPRVVYRMRYENLFGQKVDFSVEHSNRLALEQDLLQLSPSLKPAHPDTYEPDLSVVTWTENEAAAAHYPFDEWFQLTALATPGTWWYLASPDEYATARETYVRLDPIARILGDAGKLGLNDLLRQSSAKKGKKR